MLMKKELLRDFNAAGLCICLRDFIVSYIYWSIMGMDLLYTLSSCIDVFEFPPQKLKEREGESLALL